MKNGNISVGWVVCAARCRNAMRRADWSSLIQESDNANKNKRIFLDSFDFDWKNGFIGGDFVPKSHRGDLGP